MVRASIKHSIEGSALSKLLGGRVLSALPSSFYPALVYCKDTSKDTSKDTRKDTSKKYK
jgi:hypothetical protein